MLLWASSRGETLRDRLVWSPSVCLTTLGVGVMRGSKIKGLHTPRQTDETHTTDCFMSLVTHQHSSHVVFQRQLRVPLHTTKCGVTLAHSALWASDTDGSLSEPHFLFLCAIIFQEGCNSRIRQVPTKNLET